MSTPPSKWRLTKEGIQAIPATAPHQWNLQTCDFESLELARFAHLLHRATTDEGCKPRVPYAMANTSINIASSA